MSFSFSEHFPFGIDRLTVHVKGRSRRTIINPDSPESIFNGLGDLIGLEVEKVVAKHKIDPLHTEWVNAVGRNETLKSFEEWKEERNGN